MKEWQKNTKKAYRAFLHNNNARIFVSSLFLFLLSVDALKLSLRRTTHTHKGSQIHNRNQCRTGWFKFRLIHLTAYVVDACWIWARLVSKHPINSWEPLLLWSKQSTYKYTHSWDKVRQLSIVTYNWILHDGNTKMGKTHKHRKKRQESSSRSDLPSAWWHSVKDLWTVWRDHYTQQTNCNATVNAGVPEPSPPGPQSARDFCPTR